MKPTTKNKWLRLRSIGLGGGSLLVLLYLYLTDPNNGALLPSFMGELAIPIIAVWFSFIMRKVLLDYLDLEELYLKAKETSVGSAISFLAVAVIMYGLLGLFGNQVHAQPVQTYVPPQAIEHIITLKREQEKAWPSHPFPGNLPVSQSTSRVYH